AFAPAWPSAGGYNRYQYGNAWPSAAELAANVGSGTFTFTMGDATATPSLTLNTANPPLPVAPRLLSGGTWNGSTLKIDPSVATTLQINSSEFATYSTGLGGVISFNLFATADYPTPYLAQSMSQYGLGKTDPALSSLTLPAGTLVAGQDYILQMNFSQLGATNSTFFTGTGITGSPLGLSYDTSTTFINIHAVPEPGTVGFLAIAGVAWLGRPRRR
ncbi:MAG: hypothetical protein WCI73_11670, partial [Phycisphaerae bacterium]